MIRFWWNITRRPTNHEQPETREQEPPVNVIRYPGPGVPPNTTRPRHFLDQAIARLER